MHSDISHNRILWVLGPLLLVLIWLIAGWLKWLNPLFIPSLPEVLSSLKELIMNGVLLTDLLSTAWRTLAGFTISAMLGIPLGLLIGSNEWLRSSISVLIDFFRSVPGTALFPLFLLFFGIDDRAKIANAVFACTLIILISAIYGVRNANRTRISSARTMGASSPRVYFSVTLPSALPEIVGGLRISISIALVVIVVTEMFIGTSTGLGKRIFHTYQLFQIPEMYAAILITGLFGYFINLLLAVLEKKFIHWAGK